MLRFGHGNGGRTAKNAPSRKPRRLMKHRFVLDYASYEAKFENKKRNFHRVVRCENATTVKIGTTEWGRQLS
ncbi:hypothetical protein DTL42_19860 [Bremerella cremea]|uniref:Uncharacterized protein n=1 Tax=Bremerella cremea TaxID=1031537 RepID=A0A368KLL8_9BACT|nr:hypothetical protein DTL42_19860 [Bremerella cremea]